MPVIQKLSLYSVAFSLLLLLFKRKPVRFPGHGGEIAGIQISFTYELNTAMLLIEIVNIYSVQIIAYSNLHTKNAGKKKAMIVSFFERLFVTTRSV